jgi:hypothetical protein
MLILATCSFTQENFGNLGKSYGNFPPSMIFKRWTEPLSIDVCPFLPYGIEVCIGLFFTKGELSADA